MTDDLITRRAQQAQDGVEPIKAERWKNMALTKKGEMFGISVFKTEADAKTSLFEDIDSMGYLPDLYILNFMNGKCKFKDIIFWSQIPWFGQ